MNFLPIYFNLKPRNNIQKCPWELNETFHFIWKKKIMECHFGGYNLLSYFLTFRSCYVYISVPVHPFSKKLVLRSVPVLCIFKYFRIRSVFRTPLSNFRPYPYIFRTRTHGYGYGKSTDPYPPFGVWYQPRHILKWMTGLKWVNGLGILYISKINIGNSCNIVPPIFWVGVSS